MQKRTEITIETERFLVVSQSRRQRILRCRACDENVRMLSVFEAAAAADTTAPSILDLAEAGRLHFAVTLEGRLFICPNSLAAARAEGCC